MRGVFYSLMTLLLLAPLILLAVYYAQAWPQSTERLVSRSVGFSVENFVNSVAEDFPRAVEISGRSAAAAAVNHVVSNGAAVDDAEEKIAELANNGSYYGAPSYLMSNNSLLAWTRRLEAKAPAFGLNATVVITNYSVVPFDAFHVLFNATISVNASNVNYEVNFSRFYSAYKIVSIEGFEDALYALNTRGLGHRSINANTSRVYGAEALDAAASNASYVPSSHAPCFFDRLEGRKTLSAKYAAQSRFNPGIESFVNTLDLSQQGMDVQSNASVIDHYYFDLPQQLGSAVNGSGFAWLKLDAEHAVVYGVTLEP
jgi:hypothetical protein